MMYVYNMCVLFFVHYEPGVSLFTSMPMILCWYVSVSCTVSDWLSARNLPINMYTQSPMLIDEYVGLKRNISYFKCRRFCFYEQTKKPTKTDLYNQKAKEKDSTRISKWKLVFSFYFQQQILCLIGTFHIKTLKLFTRTE